MTAPLTEADVRRIVREEIAGQWIAVDGRQVVAGLLAGAGGSAVDLPFEAGDGIDESIERLLDALVDAQSSDQFRGDGQVLETELSDEVVAVTHGAPPVVGEDATVGTSPVPAQPNGTAASDSAISESA